MAGYPIASMKELALKGPLGSKVLGAASRRRVHVSTGGNSLYGEAKNLSAGIHCSQLGDFSDAGHIVMRSNGLVY